MNKGIKQGRCRLSQARDEVSISFSWDLKINNVIGERGVDISSFSNQHIKIKKMTSQILIKLEMLELGILPARTGSDLIKMLESIPQEERLPKKILIL